MERTFLEASEAPESEIIAYVKRRSRDQRWWSSARTAERRQAAPRAAEVREPEEP